MAPVIVKKTFVTNDFIYSFTYNATTCVLRIRDCKHLDTFKNLTGIQALLISNDATPRLYAGCTAEDETYEDKCIIAESVNFNAAMMHELFEWLSDAIIGCHLKEV
jgi:hypothetical protein